MSLPSTGDELAVWIVDVVLQGTAAALEWTIDSPPVVNAVDETVLILGHAVEVDTDPKVMLALARREAWRAAVGGTADRFRVSSDGQTVDLQQVHEHAVAMLDRAESDYLTAASGSSDGVRVTSIGYGDAYTDTAGTTAEFG